MSMNYGQTEYDNDGGPTTTDTGNVIDMDILLNG